jgi:serine/threonine protein kinase
MVAVAQRVVGRYVLFDELASGGMASVHFGRLLGPVGFARTVAIKRLHPYYAKDPDFRSMFIDEARLAARIRHNNVVQTLDVVSSDDELFLVMELIQGESLARLLRNAPAGVRPPHPVVVSIMAGVLHGLHAAHEAIDEKGRPLGIVHRDVSPQNVLVGTDGVARVLDFGVAKATGRLQTTRDGQIKGKLAYMAPEQLRGEVTRRTDIYAAAVVLWESLTGTRLFKADDEREIVSKILFAEPKPPSAVRGDVDPALDEIVMRALAPDPGARFPTAREMALALEERVSIATVSQVGAWVERAGDSALAQRIDLVRSMETVPASELTDIAERLRERPTTDGSRATALERPGVEDPSAIVTISAPKPRERPSRRRTLLVRSTLLLVGAAASFGLAMQRRPSRAPIAASSPSPVTADLSPASATTTENPLPAAPVASVRSPSTRTVGALTAAVAAPIDGRRAMPPRVAPPSVTATSPEASIPSAARKPACDPPYRLGPRGERLWIPECL